ncbi:retrotransposon protein, putative, ty3-gypsy subclass [Tanacetum coccineum]|uniref:Retrotransposon protein, putative, ty3-gypsy subclass n=1 Tax=Tanacetum coccineum TaxID=301880 RepID=A0ABQ5E0G7_9ASTR
MEGSVKTGDDCDITVVFSLGYCFASEDIRYSDLIVKVSHDIFLSIFDYLRLRLALSLIPVLNLSPKAPYRMAPVELKELKGSYRKMLGESALLGPVFHRQGGTVLFVILRRRMGAWLVQKEVVCEVFVSGVLVTASRVFPWYILYLQTAFIMDHKLEAITKWPRPTTVTEFRWFSNISGCIEERKVWVVFDATSGECDRLRFKAADSLMKWLELLKDYDTNMPLPSGQGYVGADDLVQKSGMIVMRIEFYSCYRSEAQRDDGECWAFCRMLCVPNDRHFREKVMTEAHSSPFTVHPGSTKMYRDLKQYFWWNGMKQDVATFERIEKTKRSKKPVKKPTRNERDKKKSEETTKDQSRISPIQQKRQSKEETMKPRANYDKCSKIQRPFGVFKVSKGQSCKKRKVVLKRK